MIIKNAIITPDGTELESTHLHDFKIYKDKITGKEYGVDGGHEYQRLIGDTHDCVVIYETTETSTFDVIRERIKWGTYGKDGKDGNEGYKQKSISELSDVHINAILKTQKQISETLRSIFEKELVYREENKIIILD